MTFEFGNAAANWTPQRAHRALASRVIVAAQTRIEGTWAAYIDAVPGLDHDVEWLEVLARGDKIAEMLAKFLFPEFAHLPYAHHGASHRHDREARAGGKRRRK